MKIKINVYLLIFLIFILFSYSFFIEPNKLEINRYVVQSSNIKNLKIVFVSDFHIKSYEKKKLENIIKIINNEKPDIILSVGDFIYGYNHSSTLSIEEIAKVLGKFKAKYGFYTSLGNHDGWYDNDKISKVLKKQGINVLSNSNMELDIKGQKIFISGVEDLMTGEPNVSKALEGITVNNSQIIMLTHSPDVFPEIPEILSLTLAGHTHGGQVRLPFIGAILTGSAYGKKYLSGWIQENKTGTIPVDTSIPIKLSNNVKTLFVTRGIGVSVLPFRFNCPPEINVIEFDG